MKNLDAMINSSSFSLAKEIGKKSKELEKAMGVLANDGVYAFIIFCKSRGIWPKLKEQIEKLQNKFPESMRDLEKSIIKDHPLSDLLFVKEILEKMLTYTRYHLKAKED
jgi:hypothetical protein